MKRQKAGKRDRRIIIEESTPTQDRAGDDIEHWSEMTKLWAEKLERGAFRELSAAHQVLRDADTLFRVKRNTLSKAIAPESHRVRYQGRIYEIVGLGEGPGRDDTIDLLTCYRPDQRGARGQDSTSPASP